MSLSGKNRSKKKVLKTVSTATERNALDNSRTRRPGIGIRNPYALADIISHGESRGWCCRPAKLNRKILEKYLGMPYKNLFDPAYGSLLFGKKTLAMFGFEIEETAPKGEVKETRPGTTVGYQIYSVDECRNGISKWSEITDAPWSIEMDLTGQPVASPPMFDDPIQGPVPDCYYIAALTSLAWHGRINIRSSNYISFYDAKGSWPFGIQKPKKPPKNYHKITLALPLNGMSEPACSHSKDKREIWVPFYEKAYACYLEAVGKIAPSSEDPDMPQICRIKEGDPCNVLNLLTANVVETRLCSSYADTNEFLKEFEENIDMTAKAVSRPTMSPAVAYTYCSGDPQLTGKAGSGCSAPEKSEVLYDDDVVPANHAFSVLGLHNDGIKDYIILRNPYGPECGTCGTKLPFNLPITALQFAGAQPYLLQDPYHIPGVNNGVFALAADDFLNRFQGYCWIDE